MAAAVVPDSVASIATRVPTTSTTTNEWPGLEPESFATVDESRAATAALFTSTITTATFDASLLRDPLKINLKRQIKKLIDVIAIHRSAIESRLPAVLEVFNSFACGLGVVVERKVLLDVVSRCLSVPQLLATVVDLFRPLLIDLFARWLDDENVDAEVKEERLVALAYVVEVYEEIFPIFHEFLVKFYPQGPLATITAHSSIPFADVERLHRLLLTYFRIQQANRELPLQLFWSLSPLSKLIWSSEHNQNDNGVKILAIRCYAYQSGMGEAEREKLERSVLGMKDDEMCSIDCWISAGGFGKKDEEGKEKFLDGWVLPMLEIQRVRDWREGLYDVDLETFYGFEDEGERVCLEDLDLSPRVANIHGVLLLRQSAAPARPSVLIATPTSIRSLQALALHISMRAPTLLTSSPSAGKALLLDHLARSLYPEIKNQIITIHLADTSLDPRSLLGSYISSSTQPGSFEWKEGVLVRAMREGRWVVFEDIDRGSSEVLGVIKPLIESLRLGNWVGARAKLDVPSRGTIIAHQNFLVFATRSLQPSRNGKFAQPTFFGAHKFCETIIRAPEGEELKMIIERRCVKLGKNAVEGLIDLWTEVKALGIVAGVRDVGLRELEKLCNRVERLLPPSDQSMVIEPSEGGIVPLWNAFTNSTLREEIYLEARDVFFGASATTTSAKDHFNGVAAIVGKKLGLDEERQEWLLKGRTPVLDIEKDLNGSIVGVSIGRTRLAAKQRKSLVDLPPSRPFAMHRPAVCLLSRIMTSVALSEPVLLTGETGTGKTSVITHLASLLGRSLISLNLSHQTESSDLIGGLKPIDTRVPASALQERFLELFGSTFSRKKNEKFESEVRKAMNEGRWKRVVGLWKESGRLARGRLTAKKAEQMNEADRECGESEAPRKRRKFNTIESIAVWDAFLKDVDEFDIQHVQGKGKFAFGFVEGPLVRALRSGDWILLDEINLASPETLECISGLLHGPTASITLTEQGSLEPVPRHPDFRLFACMNPATDVGKKDLPPNIRSRFTEIDVPPPDADKDTLLSIITQYIGACAVGDKGIIMNVAEFYVAAKGLAEKRELADGANHRPHFSMRTLARALTFASDMANMYSLRRSVWEGCLMAFTMVLDPSSAEILVGLMHKHLMMGVRNPRSTLHMEPAVPRGHSAEEFVKFGPFYLKRGPYPEDPMEEYILTPSVEVKLIDLARIVTTRRFPVLIEGPTSSGKTSSVEYLARRTGHRFVRINNHEHTDIQEYLGSYVSDPLTGKLVFKDGLLVRALRNGDWIVLDELNLAPTDVLEALNRLLDDNRELVIPETQEVVRPHPQFMLFATQNPPGLYAGRKILSRAFRNRFLEVHFQDVPQAELASILCQRCKIAPSYGKRIVAVFQELQKRRQAGRVFESKQGFATLRDLFRWANRDALGYQELADNGYMLLAERARRDDDKTVVKEVIQSIMGVQINEDALYNLHQSSVNMAEFLGTPLPLTSDVVWTKAMQRLYILVCRALKFNEPVLLVGETGSGKTSVCQIFAEATGQRLHGLNCHQNTETADIIGALRPVRNRTALEAEVFQEASSALAAIGVQPNDSSFEGLASALEKALNLSSSANHGRLSDAQNRLLRLQSIFEWHDGPLIEAMGHGDVFLLDEISLADDSVLERLNSVLEPARTIVLAEKGGSNFLNPVVKAMDAFKLVATMNPGGDYGKKELSPALRNRFTEIWVPRVDGRADLELIVDSLWKHVNLKPYTQKVLDYTEWLSSKVGDRSITSLRDIIAWVMFSNTVYKPTTEEAISSSQVFHQAAQMTYLDGLASFPQLSAYSRDALIRLKGEAMRKLNEMVPLTDTKFHGPVLDPAQFVQLGSFGIKKGPLEAQPQVFNLTAPTSRSNAIRILRACQLSKPILLEGSPGVGKTSLVTALANISGHHLCRINLSDQTDLIDLFGSDLPVEGGSPGEFAWRDAEFLKALQHGHWVLLDEMNLAPQTVLEGLNAVLDHRGTVYIPELGKSFTCHPSFRIFAAQNPINQGGGRKGLPKSFVNRFIKVYIEELTSADLNLVCQHMFPDMDGNILRDMIAFNNSLNDEVTHRKTFGRVGAPWEFNLRDVTRWGCLLTSYGDRAPVAFLRSVYLQRFRSNEDRRRVQDIFDAIFTSSTPPSEQAPPSFFSPSRLQVGHFITARHNFSACSRPERLLKAQTAPIETLGDCISQNWLAIVTGPRDSGKSHVVRALANFTGNPLREISINSATDTMDIIGSFEQVDVRAQAVDVIRDILQLAEGAFRNPKQAQGLHNLISTRDSLNLAVSCSATQEMIVSLLEQASDFLSNLTNHSGTSGEVQKRIQVLLQSPLVGRFEWIDGPLVQAMRQGRWLLLDGANLCNPSVLDRLNSLCEPNGQLTLNERGLVQGAIEVIKPHPNFRLFMTVDPQHGELSRAMRNRGIEIFVPLGLLPDDYLIVLDHLRLPRRQTLVEHANLLSLNHLSSRRGLVKSLYQREKVTTSSGRLLDQYTPLSNVMDRFPLYLIASNDMYLNASTFFLSRTFHPAYFPYFHRILDTCDGTSGELKQYLHAFVNLLSSFPSSSVINRIKDISTQVRKCSSEILSAQAMDDFVNELSKSRTETDAGAALHILDFIAAVFLQRNNTGVEGYEPHLSTQMVERIHQGVQNFLNQLSRLNEHILNLLSSDADVVDLLNALPLVLAVNKCGRYLHTISSQVLLDHSAVQVAVRMIRDVLIDAPPQLLSLSADALRLEEITSPSSGIALVDLWMQWNCKDLLPIGNFWGVQIDTVTHLLDNSTTQPDLRRQILRFASTMQLATKGPEHENQFADIFLILDQASKDSAGLTDITFENQREIRTSETSRTIDMTPKLLTLNMLSGPLDHRALEKHLDLVCRFTGEPMLRYVAFQQLSWALEAGSGTLAKYMQSLSMWMESLFDPPRINESGVDHMLAPSQLIRAIALCNPNQFTLQSTDAYERETNLHLDTTLADSYMTRQNRLESVFSTVISVLVRSLSSHNEYIQVLSAQSLRSMDSSLDALHSFADLEPPLRTLQLHLEPLRALPHCTMEQRLYRLANAWVAIGNALLKLLIPDTPVDPVAIENTTTLLRRREQDQVSFELYLHHWLERIMTGNDDSFTLRVLRHRLRGITGNHSGTISVEGRENIARLHTYWAEVWQFKNQILSEAKISSLLKSFSTVNESAILQEQVIQESITGFHQRLAHAYPEFRDLNSLLSMATSQLRLGLRLASKANRINPEAVTTMKTLISYPSVGSPPVPSLSQKLPMLSASNSIYLCLVKLELEVSIGIQLKYLLPQFETLYDQVLGLWLIDKAREAESEATSQSLYREVVIQHDAKTDVELEEQEFLSLFPSYEDSLAKRTGGIHNADPPRNVSREFMAQMTSLYLNIFSSAALRKPTLGRIDQTRKHLLSETLPSRVHELPDSLDTAALAYRLRFADNARLFLQTPIDDLTAYNFYKDSNPHEIKSASYIVMALRAQLKKLFDEWPDQMVLQHLMDRCDVILGFSLESPVAKVLSALEQLLLQTDDWEMYASRSNSLITYRQSLTELIVRWRKLELGGWNGLLESEARTFAEGASEWWFRLYNATIRGFSDSMRSGEEDEYLSKIIPLIDDFVSSSPLGQFFFRLRLLQSFERFIYELSATKERAERHCLGRIVRIIHSFLQYYEMFQSSFQSYLTEQRTVLDKEIRNLIKLASWKDINVQALKQSAQKTHHQLYKIIRKFREVLREPITHRLRTGTSLITEADLHSLPLIHQRLEDLHLSVPHTLSVTLAGPLSDLGATLKKFERLMHTKITPFVSRRHNNYADDLAIAIIATSKELSDFPIPKDLSTEKRTKFLKSLLVRKRKAFSDLLKELKAIGLAGNVTTEISRRNADPVWLRGQPVLGNAIIDFGLTKAETYFSKLFASLPELRASLSNHHSDLQTRELQRGLSFLESGFSIAIDLRAGLAAESEESTRLKKICSRLLVLASSKVRIFQKNLYDRIGDATRLMCRLSGAFTEVAQDLNLFKRLQKDSAKDTPIDELENHLARCNDLKNSLVRIQDAVEQTPVPALSKDEHETLLACLDFFNSCTSTLAEWSSVYPHLQYLFEPTQNWLSSENATCIQIELCHEEESNSSTEALLSSLLFAVQVMVTEVDKLNVNVHEDEMVDRSVFKALQETRGFTHLMSLSHILEQLTALLTMIQGEKEFEHVLQCILPFLHVYQNLAHNQLAIHAQWTKAMFKLDYVLCVTLLRLSKEGFCQPPEAEEGGEGEGEALEAADGTGLGEGSGMKNVSEEIKDESQIEGLKGDDTEEQEKGENNDDDNAIEMSEDFAGTLEDVPEDGSEMEGDDKSDGSEMDPEEKVEDLDPTDPSALDEKIWGDEEGPPDSDNTQDKTDKDFSEEQSGSSEMVAKESEETSKERSNNEGPQTEEPKKEALETEEQEQEPGAAGEPIGDNVQDADTLDLPEDMELDLGEDEKGDNTNNELEGESEGEEQDRERERDQVLEGNESEDDKAFENDQVEGEEGDGRQKEDMVNDPDIEIENNVEAEVDEQQQPDPDHAEEGMPKEVVARPDTSAGEGDANSNDEAQTVDHDPTSTSQAGRSAADSGQKIASSERVEITKQAGAYSDVRERSTEESPDDNKGNARSGEQEGHEQSSAEQKAQANPLRSLGETLKEIKQRFDEILGSEHTDVPRPKVGPSETPAQLEYLQPDDEDHDMQALGAAGEEQVAKLNDLKLVEDDDPYLDPSLSMDIDDSVQPERYEKHPEELASQSEQTASALRENIEGAVLPGFGLDSQDPMTLASSSLPKSDAEVEEDVDRNVEAELKQWKTEDFPESRGEHMWRLYESMTHDLAYALCEQLRLILEPTLATRLKGDFRTGKRLNMKKIIPYIASDYTKDKIWLRRTKPSQREYQVLIAIDDSRSMAESHSIHLAYQTLALISKALTRLESGDIAIAKFGGVVDLLHGFDQGSFTDQAGTQVFNAFTFKQKATNVLSLIDTSLKILESARERRSMSSASAADLWQLEIIVSDGICQDHDKLRTLLRKAEEQKVMIAFIVLDSLHSSTAPGSVSSKDAGTNSILTMTKAEFKSVDGKMEMQLQKYLDSFPFEYYVVLRDVEALPEVLAGTLKQFFERVSEE